MYCTINSVSQSKRFFYPIILFSVLLDIGVLKTQKTAYGPKKLLFSDFYFSCTSTHRGATFLFLSKFHIFSRSEKSWGDKEKRYIERRRSTNDDERRTTWTTIIPHQDSQDPRANNMFSLLQRDAHHI